jgi:hypothetical protein
MSSRRCTDGVSSARAGPEHAAARFRKDHDGIDSSLRDPSGNHIRLTEARPVP